jgi:hypothetical protein
MNRLENFVQIEGRHVGRLVWIERAALSSVLTADLRPAAVWVFMIPLSARKSMKATRSLCDVLAVLVMWSSSKRT